MLAAVDTVGHITEGLSPAQGNVLLALKRRGEASAEELARELEITPSAVRQHLAGLRAAGFITNRQERGRPGRPVELHHTTPAGDALFARPNDALLMEALEQIEAEEPELIGRIFERRRNRRVDELADLLDGKDLAERVALLVEVLDQEGYLATSSVSSDGTYRIALHNCAMWTVANRFGEACTTELAWLRDLLPQAEVSRASHRIDGAFSCGYDIRPNPS